MKPDKCEEDIGSISLAEREMDGKSKLKENGTWYLWVPSAGSWITDLSQRGAGLVPGCAEEPAVHGCMYKVVWHVFVS